MREQVRKGGKLARNGSVRTVWLGLGLLGCMLMMRQGAFAQAAVEGEPQAEAQERLAATKLAAGSEPLASPGGFLVVYRDGAIPGDAEVRLRMAGAALVRRHELFGIVVGSASAGELQGTMQALRRDPNVEFVVRDVVVSADALVGARAVAPAPQQVPVGRGVRAIGIPSRWGSHPAPLPPAGIGSGLGGRQSGTSPTGPDGYYVGTGQDWAVKQVGGYGHRVPGGPAYGPWDLSMGHGVRIAVLDSGVDAEHPDIAPNLALNMTEVDQTALPSACDDGSPQDQQGHGTWAASLAAAAMGPETGMMVGVAPQAEILNIKVLQRMPTGSAGSEAAQCEGGQASGLMSWVVEGIDDAVTQRADVVSLSLSVLVDLSTGEGAGLQATFDRATHAAALAGTVVVAAAGNDGFDLSNPRYIELPAQSRDVLAVVATTNPNCMENLTAGAVCKNGPVTLAYYSNHGAPLGGVAAPGGSYPEGPDAPTAAGQTGYVRGACSNGKPRTADGPPADSAHSYGCFGLGHQQYVQAMGTSASAPLAAGVAALLRGAHPEWDAYAIMNAMRSSATRGPGTVSASPFNYGQVNAASALSLH